MCRCTPNIRTPFCGKGDCVIPKQKEAKCFDCKLPYGSDSFPDLLIPNWAWKLIAPENVGYILLCPNCILKRLSEKNIKNCPSEFVSGPLAFDVKAWIGPLVDEREAIRQEERERAQKIIEELDCEILKEDLEQIEMIMECVEEGIDGAHKQQYVEMLFNDLKRIQEWKQKALKKLNETV